MPVSSRGVCSGSVTSCETAVAAAADVFDWVTPCVSPATPMTTVTDPLEAAVCTETAVPEDAATGSGTPLAGL